MGPPPVAANSILQPQNLQNSEINSAIAAAIGNLNNAGDAMINAKLPTTPAPPSTSNPPTTTTTTFDALLSLPMPTVVG
jgi:hypothetical protein